MRVLLTGFNSFDQIEVNPSQLVVEHFQQNPLPKGNINLKTIVLPTEFKAASEKMRALLYEFRPEIVLSLGLARQREGIHLERVALNLMDSPTPDNTGKVVRGRLIAPAGPVAYFTTLPIEDMQAALQRRDIPVTISNYAGAFVCNMAFYVARHEVEQSTLNTSVGFLHLSQVAERANGANGTHESQGMSLHTMVEAVSSCLDVLTQGNVQPAVTSHTAQVASVL